MLMWRGGSFAPFSARCSHRWRMFPVLTVHCASWARGQSRSRAQAAFSQRTLFWAPDWTGGSVG
jgi:hypothetical protein